MQALTVQPLHKDTQSLEPSVEAPVDQPLGLAPSTGGHTSPEYRGDAYGLADQCMVTSNVAPITVLKQKTNCSCIGHKRPQAP